MQEEVENRTINLAISTTRLTLPHARAALIEMRCKEASWKEAQRLQS